jgi:choline dehydrogenase-like flavoprotein
MIVPVAEAAGQAYDYVIVGSGASGATVARVLTESGAKVAVLEEGPAVETKSFGDKAWPGFKTLFRDAAAQAARGRTFIPVIQGRCLGGTTVVNSAIVWRLPEDVWSVWRDEYRLGEALPYSRLEKAWDQIEKELYIAPTPSSVWGEFNRLADEGRKALGVSGAPTRRNVKDCRGSARCLTGCPHGAKQSMLVSYLPAAARRGAVICAGAKVDRVLFDGGRAVGVQGAGFKVSARKGVVVASSAIQTPLLLRRSGIASVHNGEHFQGHPGCALIGIFDKPVLMWKGATQGYDIDHHRADRRFKIETISLPPEIAFARLPGVGRAWMRAIAGSGHAAIWAVQMRALAQGSVGPGPFGADIRFSLNRQDMVNLRRGLRFTAELFFAAGAREVLPGVHGLPERLKPGEEWTLEHGPADAACYSMILSHLFGTARMSARACDGVVGTDFKVHGTDNLYVVDSSIFPTNIGVNPQHSIMAAAWVAAERMVN